MINMNTKNRSFKEMRNILYEKGLDNTDFMLELKDERLIDIPENPKDWNQNLRKLIVQECKNNFWFFVREIIRIPSDSNIAYNDDYCYCNRFHLRLDTLKLFYGYINYINIYYITMGEESIFEAIAVLMIYEYMIRNDKYVNYDTEMDMSAKVYAKIHKILDLNERVLFLPTIGKNKLCRNRKDELGLNKFIFNFLDDTKDDKYRIKALNTITCLDDLYKVKNDAIIVRDKLFPFMKKSCKDYDDIHFLFDKTLFGGNDALFIKPSYSKD